MATQQQIATQLQTWFLKWGAYDDAVGHDLIRHRLSGAPPRTSLADLEKNWNLAEFRLKTWHRQAGDELAALLAAVGLRTDPGAPGTHEHNRQQCPKIPPLQVQDLLTVLHDLRTFGGQEGFRPEQTFETVLRWIRVFSPPLR